jgi:hypothetical protein
MPNNALILYLHTHIYLAGIFARDGGLCRNWRSPFSAYSQHFHVDHSNSHGSQAAEDVRAIQDTLLDIFERIEMSFRRLEMYTEVSLTTEMMDVIIEIMVEVLSILGIATKEIKQGRTSEYFINAYVIVESLTKRNSERLIGWTDMEDALKKLDELTEEEARMAVAENLKATHAVDERVSGVANTAVAIDNRVACVDDRLAGVDDRVARVEDRVTRVDDIHDKVAEVIHGAQIIQSRARIIVKL